MADKVIPILLQTLKPIKIIKWKVNEGNSISIGCVFLLYEVDEDDKHGVCKLKSTQAGTVHKLLVQEGDVVKPGGQLLELQPCAHPTVMRDMCAECGADLRKDDAITLASVPMVHSVPELKVSLEQAQKIGKADVDRLLKDRKLVLLVDLDQTLIHTTNDNIPANIKDVYHFQLYGPQSPWYHTRLRPGTHKFLENMSPYFELHICTFGARNYAHMIAMFLDQDGKLFSQRILSRDECFNPTSKTANLKALFPCGDDLVCIIDDREDVWSHAANLIHVKPYHFFQHTGDINAPPGLDKHESDEKEGIDLSKVNCTKQKKIKANGIVDQKNIIKETNNINNTDEENKETTEQVDIETEEMNSKNTTENIKEDTDVNEETTKEEIFIKVKEELDYEMEEETAHEMKEVTAKETKEETVHEMKEVTDKETKEETAHEMKEVTAKEMKEETAHEMKEVTAKETKEETAHEMKEVTANETKEETAHEMKEVTAKETKEETVLEMKEVTVKVTKEVTINETKEERTKEMKEEPANKTKEKTIKETKEETSNETKEKTTNETKEETINERKEELVNEMKEKTTSETKEEKANELKEEPAETKKETTNETQKNNSNDIIKDIKQDFEYKDKTDVSIEKNVKLSDSKEETEISVQDNSNNAKEDFDMKEENSAVKNSEYIVEEKSNEREKECNVNSKENNQLDDTNTIQNNGNLYSNNEKDNESKEDDLIEIEDPDDYLIYLEDILKTIHRTFYENYDTLEGKVPDLKKVIPDVRRNVLKNINLVFSGLVPTHIKLEQSKAYQVARSLGATVSQDLQASTTHLVAVRPGTAKVNAGRRKRNLKIVTPDWLWACAERWTKVDEQLYTLNNKGSKNRHPPPHCSSPEHIVNFEDIQDTTSRKRTPSGRFMDTINPLMSFSRDDIADMDREVEDIFNESESEGESLKKVAETDVDQAILEKLIKDKDSADEESSSSEESLTGEHPHGWRPNANSLKRSREDQDLDDESTADEFPSTKFRRGEELSSDLDIGQDSNSEGSVDAPDEIDDGDWNMMGAALEREFLANN